MNLTDTLRKLILPDATVEGIIVLIQGANATLKGRGAVTAPYKGTLRLGDHAYVVNGIIMRKPDIVLEFLNLPTEYSTVVIYGEQTTN